MSTRCAVASLTWAPALLLLPAVHGCGVRVGSRADHRSEHRSHLHRDAPPPQLLQRYAHRVPPASRILVLNRCCCAACSSDCVLGQHGRDHVGHDHAADARGGEMGRRSHGLGAQDAHSVSRLSPVIGSRPAGWRTAYQLSSVSQPRQSAGLRRRHCHRSEPSGCSRGTWSVLCWPFTNSPCCRSPNSIRARCSCRHGSSARLRKRRVTAARCCCRWLRAQVLILLAAHSVRVFAVVQSEGSFPPASDQVGCLQSARLLLPDKLWCDGFTLAGLLARFRQIMKRLDYQYVRVPFVALQLNVADQNYTATAKCESFA